MSIPSFLTKVAQKAITKAKENPVKTGAAGTLGAATLLNYLMGGGTSSAPANSSVQAAALNMPATNGLKYLSGPNPEAAANMAIGASQKTASQTPTKAPAPTAGNTGAAPMGAPAGSSMPGSSTTGASAPMGNPVIPSSGNVYNDIATIQQQRADDYLNRQGIYSNAGVPLSPSQEAGIRGSADDVYSERIAQKVGEASLIKTNNTNSLLQGLMGNTGVQGSGVSTDEYVRGLLTLPKIGNSQQDTTRILSVLKSQDPATRQSTIKALVRNNMGMDDRNTFDNNDKFAQQADYISKQFSDVSNNPYKYIGQNIVTYLGGEKSPDYTNFKSNVASLVIPLRKDFFGASLTPNEQASANQLVPDFEVDDTPTILQKVQNIADLSEFANLQKMNKTLNIATPTFTVFKARKAALRAGYTEDEINAFEQQQSGAAPAQGFSAVGNTSASTISSAIASQESNNNYFAMNKDSGALGKYQMMPATLKGLGYNVTPKEFLTNPRLQEEAHSKLIEELTTRYKGNTDKILADYYGGPRAAAIIGTAAGNTPQGKYPSINQYVAEVKSKLNLS
jgi:hypothetical protein